MSAWHAALLGIDCSTVGILAWATCLGSSCGTAATPDVGSACGSRLRLCDKAFAAPHCSTRPAWLAVVNSMHRLRCRSSRTAAAASAPAEGCRACFSPCLSAAQSAAQGGAGLELSEDAANVMVLQLTTRFKMLAILADDDAALAGKVARLQVLKEEVS